MIHVVITYVLIHIIIYVLIYVIICALLYVMIYDQNIYIYMSNGIFGICFKILNFTCMFDAFPHVYISQGPRRSIFWRISSKNPRMGIHHLCKPNMMCDEHLIDLILNHQIQLIHLINPFEHQNQSNIPILIGHVNHIMMFIMFSQWKAPNLDPGKT